MQCILTGGSVACGCVILNILCFVPMLSLILIITSIYDADALTVSSILPNDSALHFGIIDFHGLGSP